MHKPTLLDLFSGIGGFSLAFEREGFETIGFSEIDPYARAVLRKHWPHVHNYGDIRNVGRIYRPIDVITGGFPCQDISTAGNQAGIEGERSRMWFWMLEAIRRNKPTFCLIENVPALRTRGYQRIKAGLEGAGYRVRPFVVGAMHAGAKHRRMRVWIVCHANRSYGARGKRPAGKNPGTAIGSPAQDLKAGERGVFELGAGMYLAGDQSYSGVLRNLYGLPGWMDRIRCLGNSIVPQVAQIFARFIYQCLRPESPLTPRPAPC